MAALVLAGTRSDGRGLADALKRKGPSDGHSLGPMKMLPCLLSAATIPCSASSSNRVSKSKLRAKRGRPAKDGARYPGGKLKPDDKAYTSFNIARRLSNLYTINQGFPKLERAALDPRLSPDYAPGVLFHLRKMTKANLEDGEALARIAGRFDRVQGRQRSSASPSYETGRGGSGAGREDPNEADIVQDWDLLQNTIEMAGRAARKLLEEFWIEGRNINSAQLEDLLRTTRAVMHRFRRERGRQHRKRTEKPATAAATVYFEPEQPVEPPQQSREDIERATLRATIHKFRPDFVGDALEAAVNMALTFKEREKVRRAKKGKQHA
jgi:hypothetical protein